MNLPPEIASKADVLRRLCESHGVRRLELFGSALRADFNEASDVDLLVDFDRSASADAFEQYFGFKEAVEAAVGRQVDLVVFDALKNQAFIAEVKSTKQPLYVAS